MQLECALYTYIHNKAMHVVALMDWNFTYCLQSSAQWSVVTRLIQFYYHYLVHCISPKFVHAMPVFRSWELCLKKPHKTGHTQDTTDLLQPVFGSECEEWIVLQFTVEGRGSLTKEPEEWGISHYWFSY